jgi:DNA repair protein RadC
VAGAGGRRRASDGIRACFVVLLLNTRKRIKGHVLVSTGTLDTILVHPREVFRAAIVAAAAAIVIMHNHPSGESQPSEAGIKARARGLTRATATPPGACSLGF